MTISTFDIHWAAGFLEGEGWFGTANKGRTPRIVCVQVEKEPMEKLVRLFGGRLYVRPARGENQQPVWSWEFTGGLAAGVMMTLYGLLSSKRQRQIDEALAVWKAAPPKVPRGWGLRNPASPLYQGPSGRWKLMRPSRAEKGDE